MTGALAAPASAEVISLSDERASIRRRLLQRSAREVGEKAFARADHYDEDRRFSKRGHRCTTRLASHGRFTRGVRRGRAIGIIP